MFSCVYKQNLFFLNGFLFWSPINATTSTLQVVKTLKTPQEETFSFHTIDRPLAPHQSAVSRRDPVPQDQNLSSFSSFQLRPSCVFAAPRRAFNYGTKGGRGGSGLRGEGEPKLQLRCFKEQRETFSSCLVVFATKSSWKHPARILLAQIWVLHVSISLRCRLKMSFLSGGFLQTWQLKDKFRAFPFLSRVNRGAAGHFSLLSDRFLYFYTTF